MSLKLNAECDICGKKYHACNTCPDSLTLKPWRSVTDTIEHYKIFLVLSEYTNTKDKVKAKAELEKCNLSDKETFNANIKAIIDEIMADTQVANQKFEKSSTKNTKK